MGRIYSVKAEVEPFLRWAGGKSWLLPVWRALLDGLVFNRYFELFLGGGAMFFSLPGEHEACLSDLNGDLINAYEQVVRDPCLLFSAYKRLRNTEESYYLIRNRACRTDMTRAAKFIYLNQTSYNGLYRVNLRGVYNVPYGHRKVMYDAERLVLTHEKLIKHKTRLVCRDFQEALEDIGEEDLVFLDPPYTVARGAENGFNKYNDCIFSLDDQHRLSAFVDAIKEKGAYYVLTNAAHPTLEAIFRRKGDLAWRISRHSLIGGRNASRGEVAEFLFTNIMKDIKNMPGVKQLA